MERESVMVLVDCGFGWRGMRLFERVLSGDEYCKGESTPFQ